MAVFADTFTRADNVDLGADWQAGYTTHTNLQIVGNEVRSTAVAAIATESVSTYSPTAAQFAEFVFRTMSADDEGCINLRLTDPATLTCYQFAAFGTLARIRRIVAGSSTSLGLVTVATWNATTDTLRGEITGGDRLSFKRNGVEVMTISDSAITAPGRVGITIEIAAGAVTDVEVDNFSAGDIEQTFGPTTTKNFPKFFMQPPSNITEGRLK